MLSPPHQSPPFVVRDQSEPVGSVRLLFPARKVACRVCTASTCHPSDAVFPPNKALPPSRVTDANKSSKMAALSLCHGRGVIKLCLLMNRDYSTDGHPIGFNPHRLKRNYFTVESMRRASRCWWCYWYKSPTAANNYKLFYTQPTAPK